MSSEHEQFLAGIAALETQRALLGDAVVNASIAALRSKLLDLTATQAAEPAQALRQVSILFLDVVGSTALSQHLDAEEVHAVMDGALVRCTAVVRAHHGKVLQYAGDNLLAAFGATEAKEDDAERAVRCGLALLAEGRGLGAEVYNTHGHTGFNVRVGIHTGGVLLGGGVDADGTIRGLAVNIAARMEQTAPAGALRITQDTYTQVRGIFDVEPQDAIAVKGVDTPIQSYLVKRAKPRAFHIATRGIEGVATRMIGRDGEIEALREAFRRLFAERKLAAVTVVAEAGLGKSRLLTEFETWSEDQSEPFFIFRGRANPNSQAQPYGVLRDILAWRLQIADDDTLEAAKAKLERGIVPLFLHDDGEDLAEGHAHMLGHLLGLDYSASRHLRSIRDDPRHIRNRAFHVAAQVFRRVSASDGSPIVLELEDLHWADDASLDFLTYLTQVNGDVPMLILALARPSLFERRGHWLSNESIHQRIDLAPLDKTGSRLLANELLKRLAEVPAGLRELIMGSSEGNPFYMEELVKMLVDHGAIETGGPHSDRWTLHADKLLSTMVPPTLTGVLQARLDGLPALEKLVLQQASVIGAVFWDRALIALDARAEQALPALVRRELALPHAGPARYDDLREYAFRHHILHQVTYDTVLKRTRRELHDKVARWLASQTGLRALDFLGAIAEHYEKAGDTANAAEFHTRAAEHANNRYAHEVTLHHVQRALDLLGANTAADALRWRLLGVRERTLYLLGRREEQGADIEALEQLAEALDDDRRRAYAAYRRAYRAMRRIDHPETEAAARRAVALAERAGADELRLQSQRMVATAMAEQGKHAAGRALAEQSLSEARSLGLRVAEAYCLNALSTIAFIEGDRLASHEFARQNLEIERLIGDRFGEAYALSNVGGGWLYLGDHAQAQRNLEDALRLAEANGDRRLVGGLLPALSELAMTAGDDIGALRLARSALDIAVEVQARDYEVDALIQLGQAELALGRYAAAAQAYRQCRTLAGEIGHGSSHYATSGLARVALAQGETAAALQEVELLLAHAASGGAEDLDAEVELTCYQVLAAANDARAAERLELAHGKLQAQAAAISDGAWRERFLTCVPAHRAIVAAWAARRAPVGHAGGPTGS